MRKDNSRDDSRSPKVEAYLVCLRKSRRGSVAGAG